MPLSESRAMRLFGELDGKSLLDRRGHIDKGVYAGLSERAQMTIAHGAASFGDQSFFGLLQGAVEDAKGDAKVFAKGFKIEAPADARELPENTRFQVRESDGVRSVEIRVERATDDLEAGSHSPETLSALGYKLPSALKEAHPGEYSVEGGVCVIAPTVTPAPVQSCRELKSALALSKGRAMRLFEELNAAPPLLAAAGHINKEAFAGLPDRLQVQLADAMTKHGNPKVFLGELERAVQAANGSALRFADSLKVEPAADARELPEGAKFVVMEAAGVNAVQVQIDTAGGSLATGSYSPEALLVRGFKLPLNLEQAKAGTYVLTGGRVMAMVPYTQVQAPAEGAKQGGPAASEIERLEAEARTKLKRVDWTYYLAHDTVQQHEAMRQMAGARQAFGVYAAADPAGAQKLWKEVSARVPDWLRENWADALSAVTGRRQAREEAGTMPRTVETSLHVEPAEMAEAEAVSAIAAQPRVRMRL